MEVKVCGPGCASCTKAEKIVSEAISEAGIGATIEKVTDFVEMARLGVLSTPSIVIDGRIKCVGRVPDKNEVMSWIR
jgi:small redox-active disulfide protein 2